jgi:hypothetical protein
MQRSVRFYALRTQLERSAPLAVWAMGYFAPVFDSSRARLDDSLSDSALQHPR